MMTMLFGLSLVCAQTPAPQVRPASPPLATDYIVGHQDVLNVTVFEEPSLSGRFTVDADGSFNYPYIGRVKAAGLNVRQIEEQLRKRLADGYLRKPELTVEVAQYRSQNVFIMGEVRSPGRYSLEGNMSLIEALALAGGTTATAGSEVLVIHPKAQPEGAIRAVLPDQPGDAEVTRINTRDLQTGRLAQVNIRDGDTIYVTKAENFFVTGQVRTTGAYTWDPGITVLQAISLAGGLTDRGTYRGLKIRRAVGGKMVEVDAKTTDLVQPGDTIVVGRRLF